MYELYGITRKDPNAAFDRQYARSEYDKMLLLIRSLQPYHTGFENFSSLSDAAAKRGEEIAEYLLITDEPDPVILEEWDALDSSANKVPLAGNVDAFFDRTWENNEKLNAEYQAKMLSISFQSNIASPAKLSRRIFFGPHSPASVRLELPMQNDNDFWYQDWHIMRDMMFTMMDIWEFDWIVAQPSMYVGMKKELFPDRLAFGWMGWTRDHLAETGDALAMVEPVRSGTFMLLQERMMTMKKPDIETCNRAEAFLRDAGILKLIGDM